MYLLLIFAYILILSGIGFPLAKKINFQLPEQFIIAFLIGSIITGLYMFALAQLQLVNNYWVYGYVGLGAFITLLNIKYLYLCLDNIASFIKKYLIQADKWSWLFIIILIILVIWIFLLGYTPPRSADAMRYHLAQIKDIVSHHGFIFRPYLHYHFPLYFNLVFLPIFMLAKGIGLKLVVCCYFLFSLLILLRIAAKTELKYPRFLLLFLFLVPLSYHEAHIVTNDWIVIFYSLVGFLFLLESSTTGNYLAFAALGFALGIKYQAILFIPWFCIIALFNNKTNNIKAIIKLIGPLALMLLIASPFYIKNFIAFGNPVWPLALNIFPEQHNYLYQLALQFTQGVKGTHSLGSIATNIIAFIKYPLIPISIWLLILAGAICSKKTKLKIGLGLLTYFVTWWIFDPVFYVRFSMYALPIGMIAAVNFYEYLSNKKKKLLQLGYNSIVLVTFLYFIAIAIYYSIFYISYYIHRDPNSYHKYTWYYNDYQYINNNTLQNAKILCIVVGGSTYYLDRNYLRADPYSSIINWPTIKTESQLLDKLQQLKINYIYYTDYKSWSNAPGGENMLRLLQNLTKSPQIKIIFQKNEKLYQARITNSYDTVRIFFLKLNSQNRK